MRLGSGMRKIVRLALPVQSPETMKWNLVNLVKFGRAECRLGRGQEWRSLWRLFDTFISRYQFCLCCNSPLPEHTFGNLVLLLLRRSGDILLIFSKIDAVKHILTFPCISSQAAGVSEELASKWWIWKCWTITDRIGGFNTGKRLQATLHPPLLPTNTCRHGSLRLFTCYI